MLMVSEGDLTLTHQFQSGNSHLWTLSSHFSSPFPTGVVITLDVMLRIQNEQIRTFTKRYQEIRSAAVNSLTKVRANAMKNDQGNVDEESKRCAAYRPLFTKNSYYFILTKVVIINIFARVYQCPINRAWDPPYWLFRFFTIVCISYP